MTSPILRYAAARVSILLVLALLTARNAAAQKAVTPLRSTPAYVMIKIDDLVAFHGFVHPRWIKVTDFLKERKIKANIGIICNSLEGDNPKYIQWIKDEQALGLIEFWCHGYDHKQWTEDDPAKPGAKITFQEFHGTSFEHQRYALAKSEMLAKEKLGFTLPAFGSGFNSMDENTVKALEAVPELKIWLYGDDRHPAGKIVLDRNSVNIEYPTFNPDAAKFIENYKKYPNRDYFLVQGHPAQWTDERFEQFVRIIDFLTSEGAIFTTPSEYAALKHLKPVAVSP